MIIGLTTIRNSRQTTSQGVSVSMDHYVELYLFAMMIEGHF